MLAQMLTASFFCIWRQVKIKESTHASPWTKSRLLLQAVILLSDALGWHMKLLRQLQQELSGTDNISIRFFFPPLLFFATLLCFYWSVRYSHFSFILLPAKCTSFLPFLLFFFSFSSSVLPVQIMVLANAIHRFNSIFMAHCKTTPHLIPFSLFLLWLGVKLEKILQCLPNANSWLESLSTILIHSENEENLRYWLDLS